MRAELTRHLQGFDALRQAGPFDYGRAHHHQGGAHDTHLVFGSMIHGDEVGSLPAFVRVMSELASGELIFGGRATFFLGNPEAGLAGARFLESDLNRVFVEEPPDTHEGRRARQLKPILDTADVFLDLHQTILQTAQPFYISPFQEEGWRWARYLAGARVWVTRHPGMAFSSGTMCADEYVRVRGKPGITLELSEKGFGNGGEERAYRVLRRALELADAIAQGAALAVLAAECQELEFLHTVHREPFASEELGLEPGWVNFRPIQTGERLSAGGTPELVAPEDGYVLFPKYPPRVQGQYKRPLPGEIYRIVQPLSDHPTRLYR